MLNTFKNKGLASKLTGEAKNQYLSDPNLSYLYARNSYLLNKDNPDAIFYMILFYDQIRDYSSVIGVSAAWSSLSSKSSETQDREIIEMRAKAFFKLEKYIESLHEIQKLGKFVQLMDSQSTIAEIQQNLDPLFSKNNQKVKNIAILNLVNFRAYKRRSS